MELHRRAMHELEADKLLAEGGSNTRSVQDIKEMAARIKDHMDLEINKIIMEDTKLSPIYFIQCSVLRKLWKHVFKEQYVADADLFRQAFEHEMGEGILTEERMKVFQTLV